MGRRAYHPHEPPAQVLILGPWLVWSEFSLLLTKGLLTTRPYRRADCPNGCADRDLDRERALGLDRVCLRCYCHTNDPEGWTILVPLRDRKAERLRQLSLAQRKYAARERRRSKGRKAETEAIGRVTGAHPS